MTEPQLRYCGIAAQILGEAPTLSPAQVEQVINESSTVLVCQSCVNHIANSVHRDAWLIGPTHVVTSDFPVTKTYSGTTFGGDGNWAFVWTQNGVVVSTNRSYTRTFQVYENGSFTLTLQATSFGETLMRSITVTMAPDTSCSPYC